MDQLVTKLRSETRQGAVPFRRGRFRSLSLSGFHEIAYQDWGPEDADSTIVCVHGLTRQSRDFDTLASALAAQGHRVICPDLPGRGESQWLRNTMDYVFPQYCADMTTMMAGLKGRVSWVGTSLGGLIGIVLAGSPGSPIDRLVLNDIGPEVAFAAASRVGMRCAAMPSTFASVEEAESYYRKAFVTCGPMDEDQWRDFVAHSLTYDEGKKRYASRMDPKVATAFNMLWYYQIPLWNYFRAIRAPVMSIRGEFSDFAPRTLVLAMQKIKPDLTTYETPGAGHMPMLMSDGEVDAIKRFLEI